MRALQKIHTSYWAKPIPTNRFDWSATYDNYDGAEDSGNRGEIGYGATEAEAVADLLENFPLGQQCTRAPFGEMIAFLAAMFVWGGVLSGVI